MLAARVERAVARGCLGHEVRAFRSLHIVGQCFWMLHFGTLTGLRSRAGYSLSQGPNKKKLVKVVPRNPKPQVVSPKTLICTLFCMLPKQNASLRIAPGSTW